MTQALHQMFSRYIHHVIGSPLPHSVLQHPPHHLYTHLQNGRYRDTDNHNQYSILHSLETLTNCFQSVTHNWKMTSFKSTVAVTASDMDTSITCSKTFFYLLPLTHHPTRTSAARSCTHSTGSIIIHNQDPSPQKKKDFMLQNTAT